MFSLVVLFASGLEPDTVTLSDCGGIGLEPSTLQPGETTTATGKLWTPQEVAGGTYVVKMSGFGISGQAGFLNDTGKICEPKTFNLPLDLGSVKFNGLACPVSKGATDLSIDITMNRIPSSMAAATIKVTATESDLLCINLNTKPNSPSRNFFNTTRRIRRLERVPVPDNDGACDRLEGTHSCERCWSFRDGRDHGADCVWIPTKGRCYPVTWAIDENESYDYDCECMWRQTTGCSPTGTREPDEDKDCDAAISKDWSGYCECQDGTTLGKGCIGVSWETCRDACREHTEDPTATPTSDPTACTNHWSESHCVLFSDLGHCYHPDPVIRAEMHANCALTCGTCFGASVPPTRTPSRPDQNPLGSPDPTQNPAEDPTPAPTRRKTLTPTDDPPTTQNSAKGQVLYWLTGLSFGGVVVVLIIYKLKRYLHRRYDEGEISFSDDLAFCLSCCAVCFASCADCCARFSDLLCDAERGGVPEFDNSMQDDEQVENHDSEGSDTIDSEGPSAVDSMPV